MKGSRFGQLLAAMAVRTFGGMGLTAGVQATAGPVASGRLVGPDAASAQIRLLVWPNDHYLRSVRVGDNVKTIEVGRGRADATGRFAVAVDRTKLTSRYRQADGSANLQLLASTGVASAAGRSACRAPCRHVRRCPLWGWCARQAVSPEAAVILSTRTRPAAPGPCCPPTTR